MSLGLDLLCLRKHIPMVWSLKSWTKQRKVGLREIRHYRNFGIPSPFLTFKAAALVSFYCLSRSNIFVSVLRTRTQVLDVTGGCRDVESEALQEGEQDLRQ